MPTTSFGQVIPVTGLNLGFVGTVSRLGERVITARQFVQQTVSGTYNLNFGDPAVQVPTSTGGVWTSVLDYVTASTANIANVANNFAGFAVREVQQGIVYPVTATPGTSTVGYYYSGQIAEVAERANGTILLSVSASPKQGDQVYTRVVINAAVTAGLIGDWETEPVASDLFTLNGITAAAAAATSLTGITFTGVYVGQVVSGAGIPAGASGQAATYVVSGTGTAGAYTTIVLSQGLPTAITATSVLTFSNLVALPRTVLRTGYVDANSVVEITIKERNAA